MGTIVHICAADAKREGGEKEKRDREKGKGGLRSLSPNPPPFFPSPHSPTPFNFFVLCHLVIATVRDTRKVPFSATIKRDILPAQGHGLAPNPYPRGEGGGYSRLQVTGMIEVFFGAA